MTFPWHVTPTPRSRRCGWTSSRSGRGPPSGYSRRWATTTGTAAGGSGSPSRWSFGNPAAGAGFRPPIFSITGGNMSFHVFVRRLGPVLGVLLALAALTASGAQAQTSTGAVRGYVKNANGVPLADAEVRAKSVATGVVRSGSAHTDGFYTLVGLAPGAYDLTARRIGSAPQTRRGEVQIGATFTADFTLTAGAGPLEAG